MTTVYYEVKDLSGNISVVNTLSEAKAIIKEKGGVYTVRYDEHISTWEAYCKDEVRIGGRQSRG